MFDNHEATGLSVVLIAGGKSGEREISLKSAEGAKEALTEAGYTVTQIDPADIKDLKRLLDEKFDVAFICLHGKGGEDGSIQGFLETAGIPYIGSGILSSALSIDKTKAKFFFRDAKIPTPEYLVIKKENYPLDAKYDAQMENKRVVKAATEGSSIGVYITEGISETKKAIEEVFKIDDTALVERFIEGIELTVVVLGDGANAKALPIIEIIPVNASYDFDAKYLPGGSEHICPARLSDATTAEIQEIAIRAHNALECTGVSRTDFILDEEGVPWVLETNTIPGMTATSLLPDAAQAAGIAFSELCTMLIDDALSRSEK